jgi:ADP-ribose pyrophosphatase YjhB (NUDIX family)
LLWVWRAPLPDWLRWALIWLITPKFVTTVAAVVRNERGEVLLFHHTYRKQYPWGLPGGLLERSEEPALAIAREILEESGLVVRVLCPLQVTRDARYARLDIIYLAEVVSGAFRPSLEVSEAGFFPLDALPHLTIDTRELIRSALRSG